MQSENSLKQRLLPPKVAEFQPLGFLSQIWLLTYKNIILTIKNPKNLIFLIITPFLLSAFMFGFQDLAVTASQKAITNPTPYSIPPFPRCTQNNCISLDYRIIGTASDPWIDFAIAQIKAKTGLSDSDISMGGYITDTNALNSYYKQTYSSNIQIGVLFCSGRVQGLLSFCDGKSPHSYYLMLQKVNSIVTIFHDILQPFPIDPIPVSLKLMLDNAILKYNKSPSIIQYMLSMFPIGPNRYIQNYDIISSIGAFYYLITPLFAFLFIQNQIVREKQYKLRQGLNIFGASHTSYWISWFFIAVFYSLVGSLSTTIAGLCFGFAFFTQTPFIILFLFVMFPFMLSLQFMAFFLSTLSPNMKAANAISYALVLFAIVVQSFVADNNILSLLFTTQPSALVEFIKVILLIYPPFSYTKIFTNITIHSGFHFNIRSRIWEAGIPYTFYNFSESTNGPLPFTTGFYDRYLVQYCRYSDLTSMGLLYADCIFYALLTWYFDNLLSSNRGRGQPILFPFYRIKALFIKDKPKDAAMQMRYFVEGQEQSAARERARVFENSANHIPAFGMRIKYLCKTFSSMCSKEKVEAIKQLSLQIEPNELMAVLGHNGAGKTTLINVLTGVLNPDECHETEIIINKQSINNIDDIRKHIGVCSQFDILWGELTAEDHLYMFARLKNIPKQSIDDKIDQMLQFVNLPKERKNTVKGFSGGMRRRLSLALAAIGDPKIILLDEPTTGLDPKVRQQVWHLIQRLKKNKSIILTTHSMEEADVLADRICIMARGTLKCIGTSLYLKQLYGEGHRITLNIQKHSKNNTLQAINRLFPSAVFIDLKGGNLIVGVPLFDQLIRFVKLLQSDNVLGLDQHSLKSVVKDWNVSHCTLQEVFLKVTKQKIQ